MNVRQTAFLEFNCVDVSKNGTKYLLLDQIVNKNRHVQMKDAGDNVGSVSRTLLRKKSVRYFDPGRITCECDKEIESVIVSSECDCILKALIHVTGTADER